jgi:Outer membrane protein beta-barrel domain
MNRLPQEITMLKKFSLALALFLGATLMPSTAFAQLSLGLSAGLYEPNEGDGTEVFGARAAYRLTPNFAVELAYSQVNVDDLIDEEEEPIEGGFDIDFENIDFSLQYFPSGSGFFIFGGPGVAKFSFDTNFIGIPLSGSDDVVTAHLGLGYDWQVGESFFVRPEVRARRYFGDESFEDGSTEISYDETDFEGAVVLGWRFGK